MQTEQWTDDDSNMVDWLVQMAMQQQPLVAEPAAAVDSPAQQQPNLEEAQHTDTNPKEQILDAGEESGEDNVIAC